MTTYQQRIEHCLEKNGWRILDNDSDHNDWWADEFWTLESTWTSLESNCFITFLVDPQYDGNRKPREAVWAVCASKSKPLDLSQTREQLTITLDKEFDKNIKRFVKDLDVFRKSHGNT